MNPKDASDSTTLLVHGLWYGRFSLNLLVRRLTRKGLNCRRFGYPTVRQTLTKNARSLYHYAQSLETPSLHLVGHSLGGLVILRMLDEFGRDLPPGRVVLLGSPVHGSAVAQRLTTLAMIRPLSKTLIGRAASGLEYGFAHAPPGRDVGMIAGSTKLGLGQLVSHLDQPHDGTVAVSETQLPGATDHIVVQTSHTGLITSSRVADQVESFIQHGRFQHAV
ncbi:MAG: alpha/beta hydrolase [Pseudomonadota bacterium]